jgi:hypothetical protein
MAEGLSDQGIAAEFVITLRDGREIRSSILTKLDLPTAGSDSRRAAAVLLYLRG